MAYSPKEKVVQIHIRVYTLEVGGVWTISEIPLRHLSCCSGTRLIFCLFSSHNFQGLNFMQPLFVQTTSFKNSCAPLFAPDSYYKPIAKRS